MGTQRVDPETGAIWYDGEPYPVPPPPGMPADLTQPMPVGMVAPDAVDPAAVIAAFEASQAASQPAQIDQQAQFDQEQAAIAARLQEERNAAPQPQGPPDAQQAEFDREQAAIAERLAGSESVSRGYSKSGITDANIKLARGVYEDAGVPQALDQLEQDNLRNTELQNLAAQANYEAQVATIGADLQARQEQIDRDTRAALQYEHGLADNRRQWEADVAAAKQNEEAAKSRYAQSVAQARAMVVTPGLTGGQGVVATFALMGYSWLSNAGPGAPKLVDIPAMINQIVANSMSAQESNITNAWSGVKADAAMIEMAQQDAADANEAAIRLKGMLLEQYTASVQTSAAMFAGSQPAIAAAQALADAQADHAANAALIANSSFTRDLSVAQERKKYSDGVLAASQERYSEQMALKRAYAARPKAAKVDPPHAPRFLLYQKNEDGTFAPLRALNLPPDSGTGAAADLHKAVQGISAVDSISSKALAAAAELEGKYRGPGAKVLSSDPVALADYAQWKALMGPITRAISGSGASLTGAEQSDYDDSRAAETGMESIDAWLSGNDNLSRKVAGALTKMRGQLVSKLQPYTREITPTDLANEQALGAYAPLMGDFGSDPTTAKTESAYAGPKAGDPYPAITTATTRAMGLTRSGERNAGAFTPTALSKDYTSKVPADAVAAAVEAKVKGGARGRFQKIDSRDPIMYIAGKAMDKQADDIAASMKGTYPAYIVDVVDLWRLASTTENPDERSVAESNLNAIAASGIPESAAAADFALSTRFDPAWYTAPAKPKAPAAYRTVPR